MPTIRNSQLIKRFTDFFKLKTNDFLDSEAGRMLVPVITEPIPKNIIQLTDALANDSDKTFTVPSGRQWKFLYGIAILSTSATAGNRFIEFNVRDAEGNQLWSIRAGNTQIASTTEEYSFNSGGGPLPSEHTVGVHLIPVVDKLILNENFSIRIFDSTVVDAAADDLTIRLIVEEIDITGE